MGRGEGGIGAVVWIKTGLRAGYILIILLYSLPL